MTWDVDAANVAQDARQEWRLARIRRVGRWSLAAIIAVTLVHVGVILWASAVLDGWAYWPLVVALVAVRLVVDKAIVHARDREWSTDRMNVRWAELYSEAAQLLAPVDALIESIEMNQAMDKVAQEEEGKNAAQ